MNTPSMMINYVTDIPRARNFYASVLGIEPVEDSPTFCMFVFASGLKLGLWRQDGVVPAPQAAGGGGEMAIAVTKAEQVDQWHGQAAAQGIPVLQAPTDMDFGRTFTMADPDGHRIRVFYPIM